MDLINQAYFKCNISDNDINCDNQIGYLTTYGAELSFQVISLLGFISNFILILYNINLLSGKKKRNRKKTSMRKLFGFLPITDCLISIYWILSSFFFKRLSDIKKNYIYCSILSLFYIFIFTFQFVLINFILYHFRKINTNPIEGILKPDKNVRLYIIISILSSMIVSGIADFYKITGIGPMNTCFINTKYANKYRYIFFVPIVCIIIAVIQVFHDLFFMHMFSADKGIRKLHRKNSCYVLIFCFLHLPMLVLITYSLILKKNHFRSDKIMKLYIQITTIFTCLIPLLISLIRQFQGLTRFECFADCVKRKKRKQIRKRTSSFPYFNTNNNNNSGSASSFHSDSVIDPFEWLENHIMKYFMRDILIGVATAIKKSKRYRKEKGPLTSKDYKTFIKHKINFGSYCLNDETVKNSEYLDVKVINYAPKCFAYLRKIEKINIDEMVESFLPKNNKQGIKKSEGKSGSFFISTDDNKYMIKTLKADEVELIKHVFLRKYVNYITKNPNSLLCRLYGMYNIILGQGDEVLVIVMRNVIGDFKENTIVKFDLKGSTYNRKANFDLNNVMKDLDFNEIEKSIILSESSIQKLRINTLKDSRFLCSLDLMDYSLFLVKLTLSKEEAADTFGEKIEEKQETAVFQLINSNNENKNENNDIINVNDYRMSYNGVGKIHDVRHYKQYLYPSLNKGAAYIISIIDYFQIFNFFKLMESEFKNKFQARKNTISCIEPRSYSSRFIKYINQLTNLKEILINEEKQKDKIDENNNDEEENNEDSDDSDILLSKIKRDINSMRSLDFKNEKGNNLLLPFYPKEEINDKKEMKSVIYGSMNIKDQIL